MNIFQFPLFLVYGWLPSKPNDFSFGLVNEKNIPELFEQKAWVDFENIFKDLPSDDITKLIDGLCLSKRYDKEVEAYLKENDSELSYLISGVYYTYVAWEIRTGGWAKNIKEDQWDGFLKYLEKAEASLLKVAKSDSLKTEAKARLIRVYLGLSRKSKAIDLFNQCIISNPNHYLAHVNMFKILTPRWSGSVEELKQFINSVGNPKLRCLLELMYYIEMYSDILNEYSNEGKAKRLFRTHYLKEVKVLLNNDFNLPKGSIVSIYTCNHLAYLYHIIGKRGSRNKVLKKIPNAFTQQPWAYFGMHSERDVKFFKAIGIM